MKLKSKAKIWKVNEGTVMLHYHTKVRHFQHKDDYYLINLEDSDTINDLKWCKDFKSNLKCLYRILNSDYYFTD